MGRLLLADITSKIGERTMVFCYIGIALIMQILFWFIPNVVANAVVVSLLGFVIGPFFPAGLMIITKVLPRDIHVAVIGMHRIQSRAGTSTISPSH